ncbi:hypothetical protein VPH35_124907 [Triticum aestivum]
MALRSHHARQWAWEATIALATDIGVTESHSSTLQQFILFLSPLYWRKHLVKAIHAGLHLRGGSRCSFTGERITLQLHGIAAPTASRRPGSSKVQHRSCSICIWASWQLPLQLGSAESADGAAVTRIGEPNPHGCCCRSLPKVASVLAAWHSLKLVTFHGKGGSSKPTAVAVAAQAKLENGLSGH